MSLGWLEPQRVAIMPMPGTAEQCDVLLGPVVAYR